MLLLALTFLTLSCDLPSALQERFDKELQRQAVAHDNQSATMETDGSAGTNGVSDVTEAAAEGTNERQEQVRHTCSCRSEEEITPVMETLSSGTNTGSLTVSHHFTSTVFLF